MFEEHGFQYYFRIAFTNTSRKENSHTFFWLQFKEVLSSLLFQYPLKKKNRQKVTKWDAMTLDLYSVNGNAYLFRRILLRSHQYLTNEKGTEARFGYGQSGHSSLIKRPLKS